MPNSQPYFEFLCLPEVLEFISHNLPISTAMLARNSESWKTVIQETLGQGSPNFLGWQPRAGVVVEMPLLARACVHERSCKRTHKRGHNCVCNANRAISTRVTVVHTRLCDASTHAYAMLAATIEPTRRCDASVSGGTLGVTLASACMMLTISLAPPTLLQR